MKFKECLLEGKVEDLVNKNRFKPGQKVNIVSTHYDNKFNKKYKSNEWDYNEYMTGTIVKFKGIKKLKKFQMNIDSWEDDWFDAKVDMWDVKLDNDGSVWTIDGEGLSS